MQSFTRAVALTLLLLASGCAHLRVGRAFDPSRADQIQPGLTERAQVYRLLGRPFRAKRIGDQTVEVHQLLTPSNFTCVLVSYRGDQVVKVTRVQ